MCVSVGKINCYLCSKIADILPHGEDAVITRVHCQNCGEYVITGQAILNLRNAPIDIKYILSSQTFENYYYEQKPLTIKTDHIQDAKDITFLEKLYKLSYYLYNETKIRGVGSKIDGISHSQFYCKNNDEYLYILETLKSMKIIDFEKIINPSVTGGDCISYYRSPTMLSNAMINFESGINNIEDFRKVYMTTKDNGNPISLNFPNSNNQFNFNTGDGNFTAVQNNSIDIKELNTLLENIYNSLPEDTDNKVREEVKENLAIIQSEVQSPNRKNTIIKNSYNVLDGIAKTTGFLASLAKLYEFIQPYLQ